ncbi:hypothetical protein ACLOJK_027548 [Asimina triloba]
MTAAMIAVRRVPMSSKSDDLLWVKRRQRLRKARASTACRAAKHGCRGSEGGRQRRTHLLGRRPTTWQQATASSMADPVTRPISFKLPASSFQIHQIRCHLPHPRRDLAASRAAVRQCHLCMWPRLQCGAAASSTAFPRSSGDVFSVNRQIRRSKIRQWQNPMQIDAWQQQI